VQAETPERRIDRRLKWLQARPHFGDVVLVEQRRDLVDRGERLSERPWRKRAAGR
jgi:hypothetical protein